jgi:hypothetical protein
MKGNIYRLYSLIEPTLLYYGSTQKSIEERLKTHEKNYRYYLKHKNKYISSFLIIASSQYKIELVEEYECDSILELRMRERFYIENNLCINKNIPSRTPKEYQNYCYNINRWGLKDKFKNLPKIVCCCGGHYINRKNRHLNSNRHTKYLENEKLLSTNNINEL